MPMPAIRRCSIRSPHNSRSSTIRASSSPPTNPGVSSPIGIAPTRGSSRNRSRDQFPRCLPVGAMKTTTGPIPECWEVPPRPDRPLPGRVPLRHPRRNPVVRDDGHTGGLPGGRRGGWLTTISSDIHRARDSEHEALVQMKRRWRPVSWFSGRGTTRLSRELHDHVGQDLAPWNWPRPVHPPCRGCQGPIRTVGSTADRQRGIWKPPEIFRGDCVPRSSTTSAWPPQCAGTSTKLPGRRPQESRSKTGSAMRDSVQTLNWPPSALPRKRLPTPCAIPGPKNSRAPEMLDAGLR